MHAVDGEVLVGAAASVGERDVVGVVEALLLSHTDGLDEALLDACLHLWLVEAPAVAVAEETAPVPAMVDVGPGDVAYLRGI